MFVCHCVGLNARFVERYIWAHTRGKSHEVLARQIFGVTILGVSRFPAGDLDLANRGVTSPRMAVMTGSDNNASSAFNLNFQPPSP